MELPPERSGQPAPPDLAARREAIAAAVAGGMWAVEPKPTEVSLGGVRALRFDPPAASRACILHLHGGAFRIGCPEQIATFAAALAARCGVTVVCPAYRLAPEHPFPAGLRDTLSAFSALQRAGERRIILSGDSAGGGLAAGLAALVRDNAPPPIGLILLSAWLDLTVSSASFATNAATDPLFSRAAAVEATGFYLQGLAADHVLASPLLGGVEGFPPTFVSAGAGEVLVDDARAFHARLRAAGVAASLDIVPGMEHVAITRDFGLTGAAETFEAVVAFIAALTD